MMAVCAPTRAQEFADDPETALARLDRPKFDVPPPAESVCEVELADRHRPGCGPQAVEQVPGNAANDASNSLRNVKKGWTRMWKAPALSTTP